MAVLWMDDFRGYGPPSIASSDRMLNGPYAQVTGYNNASRRGIFVDPDPNDNRLVLACSAAGASAHNIVLRKVLPGPRNVVGMAMRMWMTSLPESTAHGPEPFVFATPDNVVLLHTRVYPDGGIGVWTGTGNAKVFLGRTDGPVLVANAWQHVECKMRASDVEGSIEIRVEGVTVLKIEDIDTLAAVADKALRIGQCRVQQSSLSTGVGVQWYMKDFAIWDGTGARNNDFLGSVIVERIFPMADVNLGGWVPNAGANGFSRINEGSGIAPDEDVGYIAAGVDPLPAPSVFELTDLPEDITTVRSVMTWVRARKIDGGDGDLRVSLISNGEFSHGVDRPISAAYTYWTDVHDVDPNTDSGWTPGAVDNARLQLDRTM